MSNFVDLLFFIGLLLVYQCTGEFILFIRQLLFPSKSFNCTLIEQFTYSLLFGIFLNTVITIVIVFNLPFKLWILLCADLVICSVVLIFSTKTHYTIFWIRIYRIFQLHQDLRKIIKKATSMVLFVTIGMFVFLYLYLQRIANNYPFLHDIFLYMHHTLDAIKYGWNFYDPNYLGTFYSTKFFSFLLVPFVSINLTNWYWIVSFLLTGFQFLLLFLLLYSMFSSLKIKYSLLSFIPLLSGVYFLNWFIFFLPSTVNILIFLMLSQFTFKEQVKSGFLSVITFIFFVILHFSSFFILGLPYLLTILLFFLRSSTFSNNILKIRQFSRLSKAILILILLVICIGIALFLSLSGLFHTLLTLYMGIQRSDQTDLTLKVFNQFSVGFSFTILLYLTVFIFIFYYYKKKNESGSAKVHFPAIFILYLIISLFLTIYLSKVTFFSQILRTLYLSYRFFTYHTLSLVILTPFVLSLLFSNGIFVFIANTRIGLKINGFLKKIRLDIAKITYPPVVFLIIILTFQNISVNVLNAYNGKQYANYWPTLYYSAILTLNPDVSPSFTYFFNPNCSIQNANWNFFHTYLGDDYCIDIDEVKPYLSDYKYDPMNLMYTSNYQIFSDYIFNESKSIYSFAGNYRYLPESNRSVFRVNFLFLDSLSNPHLISLLLDDSTHFNLYYFTSGEYFSQTYSVYIFSPNY